MLASISKCYTLCRCRIYPLLREICNIIPGHIAILSYVRKYTSSDANIWGQSKQSNPLKLGRSASSYYSSSHLLAYFTS